MLSVWFWWAATSYLTLGTLGLATLAALAIGYLPFVKYFPVVGPYVMLAKFLAVFGLCALVFIVGARVTDERLELANLQVQVARQNAAAEQDQRLATAASKQLQAYDARVRVLEGQISKGICLPEDDAERLRQLWKK